MSIDSPKPSASRAPDRQALGRARSAAARGARHAAAGAGACRVGRGRCSCRWGWSADAAGLGPDVGLEPDQPPGVRRGEGADRRAAAEPERDRRGHRRALRAPRRRPIPPFAAHVRGAGRRRPVAAARVEQISSYLDPGGQILVSADRHATVLPVVLAEPEDERIADLDLGRAARRRQRRLRRAHHRQPTRSTATSPSCPASDLSKGELQFGLPGRADRAAAGGRHARRRRDPDADGDHLDHRRARHHRRRRPGVPAEPVHREHGRRDGPGAGDRLLAVHRRPPARGAPPRRATRARRS